MPIEVIKKYPEMIRNSIDLVNRAKLPSYEFDEILVCGIGGSGIGGYLLKNLLSEKVDCPVDVYSGYELPYYADDRTLVFCVSYSGNTEETLSQFAKAMERGCKIIAFSSNGKLEEWCKSLSVPFVKLPQGFLPREGLPYIFIPMIAYLQKIKFANFEKDLKETIKILMELNLQHYFKLVEDLKDSVPVIYASNKFAAVAKRMQNQFNENSKIPAKNEILPELNHNEVNAYEDEKLNEKFSLLLLRDEADMEQIKTRFTITGDIARSKAKAVNEIYAKGSSLLAKMFFLIAVGDYLSYKVAEAKNVDPAQVKFNDIIKEKLKKHRTVEKLEEELSSRRLDS